MPHMTSRRDVRTSDRVRQIIVAVCAVVAIVGGAVGSGAFGGTAIQDAAGGALRADATLLAPAVPAFGIWSVIYLGLIGYAIWQALPAQATSSRQRALGYLVAASLVLNAGWILSVQADLLALSVVVIVALVAVLAVAFARTVRSPARRVGDMILTDGVIGLYLGWVSVATAAGIAATLVAAGFTGWGLPAEAWSTGILVITGAIAITLAVVSRGRISPMLSLCWGLAWIAVARLGGSPHSTSTAITAIAVTAAVIIVTAVCRVQTLRKGR
nr:tryptophan-rich sensory protein [Microbacterium bovistercoris]